MKKDLRILEMTFCVAFNLNELKFRIHKDNTSSLDNSNQDDVDDHRKVI